MFSDDAEQLQDSIKKLTELTAHNMRAIGALHAELMVIRAMQAALQTHLLNVPAQTVLDQAHEKLEALQSSIDEQLSQTLVERGYLEELPPDNPWWDRL